MLEYAYFTFLLILLAALVTFLHFRIEKREEGEDANGLAQEGQPAGTAFDVSAIAPRIERLRLNHLAARRTRAHDTFYRRGLLATVREAVTSLSFFRGAKLGAEMQKYDA